MQTIKEYLSPDIAMLGVVAPDRAAWIKGVFRIFDTLLEAGCPTDEILNHMARQTCGQEDDGHGGQARETAKQLLVSTLVARELGTDPLHIFLSR